MCFVYLCESSLRVILVTSDGPYRDIPTTFQETFVSHHCNCLSATRGVVLRGQEKVTKNTY